MVRGKSFLIESISHERCAARCRLLTGCDYYTKPVSSRRVQLQLIRSKERIVLIGDQKLKTQTGLVDLHTSISAYRMFDLKSGKFMRDCDLAQVCENKYTCSGIWIDCIPSFFLCLSFNELIWCRL
jgi:hypothetical protein